jgi:outer membrane receptor protein involved in Fe transport
MKTSTFALSRVTLAICSLACSSGVWAQAAAPADTITRVEITAEKRLTTLDTTPAAVTALSGQRLAEQGVAGLADAVALVPNMSFTTGYAGASQVFIRGIGNVFFTAGGDPGVAMYADGSYLSDATSTNIALFDLQRMEVLRGPQGALYGRNATGGAVNLVSAAPTAEFRAQFGALVGDYGRRESEGFVSGPLGGSGLGARLSYQIKNLDGFTRNTEAGRASGPVLAGGPDTVGAKALDGLGSRAVRLQLGGDLGAVGSLRVIGNVYRQMDDGPANKLLVDPVMISQLLYGATPSTDPRTVKSQGSSNRVDVDGLQLLYDLPLGGNTLSVVAGMRRSKAEMFWDGDTTEALTASTRFQTRSTDNSIDVHLGSGEGSVQWLVGATWLQFDQRQDIRVQTQIPLGFLVPGQPVTVPFPGGAEFLLGGDVRTRSTAIYGDLRWRMTKQLSLLAGLRTSRDTKTADEYQTVAAFGINGAARPEGRWSSTPGSVGLEYQLAKDMLLYTRASRGFKSGAINVGGLQGDPVRPETVTSLELGFKSAFLGNRGAFSGALFGSRYKDMQVSQVGLASAILTNASAAKINGAELELALRPVRELTLGLNLGLLDPTYTDFENVDLRNAPGTRVNVSGKQLAQVSRAQASLSAEWSQPVGSYTVSLRSDYTWRDKFYFTEFNTPDAMQSAYGLLNLSASLRPSGGGWKVYGYVRNVGDKAALTSMNISSPVLGSARQVSYTPPRHVGLGVSLDL